MVAFSICATVIQKNYRTVEEVLVCRCSIIDQAKIVFNEHILRIRGRSLTTLAKFWPLLTPTYSQLTLVKEFLYCCSENLHTVMCKKV